MAKKIMFSDKYGLTQAVLEGRKTQTRRIVNEIEHFDLPFNSINLVKFNMNDGRIAYARSRYKIGEEVAIAQSYKDIFGYKDLTYVRRRELEAGKCNPAWHNKMFVRADLMLNFIKITNVRVERLQDISDEDCLKEGVIEHKYMTPEKYSKIRYYYTCRGIGVQREKYFEDTMFRTARDAYAVLIDKVSGKGTWESNPWVFVYDFELINNQK